jgi:hypothetical protein
MNSNSPDNVAVVVLSALLGLTLVTVLYDCARRRYGLPPGPAPCFFSGNTYQIPASEPWKVYANWSQIFGERRVRLLLCFPTQPGFQEAL